MPDTQEDIDSVCYANLTPSDDNYCLARRIPSDEEVERAEEDLDNDEFFEQWAWNYDLVSTAYIRLCPILIVKEDLCEGDIYIHSVKRLFSQFNTFENIPFVAVDKHKLVCATYENYTYITRHDSFSEIVEEVKTRFDDYKEFWSDNPEQSFTHYTKV